MKILTETYKIININDCIKIISSNIRNQLHNTSSRGNGVATTIICEILNKLYGTNLNPKDYFLHHRNGKHDDNSLNNLVLFGKNLSHTSFHHEVWESAIQDYVSKIYHLPSESNINSNLFENLNSNLFLSIYANVCELKTTRKDRQIHTDEIIIVKDFII